VLAFERVIGRSAQPATGGQRFGLAPLWHERLDKTAERHVETGPQLYCPLQARRRFGQPAAAQIGDAEVAVRLRTRRVEPRNFVKQRNCLSPPPGVAGIPGREEQRLLPLPDGGRGRGPWDRCRGKPGLRVLALAAVLIFLAAAAWARIVATDLFRRTLAAAPVPLIPPAPVLSSATVPCRKKRRDRPAANCQGSRSRHDPP